MSHLWAYFLDGPKAGECFPVCGEPDVIRVAVFCPARAAHKQPVDPVRPLPVEDWFYRFVPPLYGRTMHFSCKTTSVVTAAEAAALFGEGWDQPASDHSM